MKVINVLLIIIFILFVILGIKIYHSNSSEHEYSVQDIQKILDKAKDIKNYECTIGDVQYKRKDYKIVKENEEVVVVADYLSDEAVIFKPGSTVYLSYKVGEFYIPEEIYSSNSIIIDDFSELKLVDAKETVYNGENCLEAKFEGIYTNSGWLANPDKEGEYLYNITLWIDCENGLIMKYEGEMLGEKQISEYTYKFNTVTEEDVNPDLTGYKKIETND